MTNEQADRLEKKIDQLLELAPTIDALGSVLVRRNNITERLGLNKNTLAQNSNIAKFEESGSRKTFIEIGDVAVLRQRKQTRKQPK